MRIHRQVDILGGPVRVFAVLIPRSRHAIQARLLVCVLGGLYVTRARDQECHTSVREVHKKAIILSKRTKDCQSNIAGRRHVNHGRKDKTKKENQGGVHFTHFGSPAFVGHSPPALSSGAPSPSSCRRVTCVWFQSHRVSWKLGRGTRQPVKKQWWYSNKCQIQLKAHRTHGNTDSQKFFNNS